MVDQYDPQIAIHGNSGDAVVLVPGMDGTGQLFYRQVPLLARTHRVATYALRNHAPSLGVLASDLVNVIEAAAPETRRAVVVGESFGGALALHLALTAPSHVSALVILNSFPHFAPQIRLRLARWALRAVPWGMMGFVRRLTAFRLHSSHTHRHEIERFLALTARASRSGYLNRLDLLTRYDVRGRLHEIRVPTLFLAADQDHLVPSVKQARFMAARVPGAVVRVLEGHGHICLIAPDVDLAAILREWDPDVSGRCRW
jgi:pimeloyl-ACP methyl ester carboxylesterase